MATDPSGNSNTCTVLIGVRGKYESMMVSRHLVDISYLENVKLFKTIVFIN